MPDVYAYNGSEFHNECDRLDVSCIHTAQHTGMHTLHASKQHAELSNTVRLAL